MNAPSCPLCGRNDQSDRYRGHWLCGVCWTYYGGDANEWAVHARQRSLWQRTHPDRVAS